MADNDNAPSPEELQRFRDAEMASSAEPPERLPSDLEPTPPRDPGPPPDLTAPMEERVAHAHAKVDYENWKAEQNKDWQAAQHKWPIKASGGVPPRQEQETQASSEDDVTVDEPPRAQQKDEPPRPQQKREKRPAAASAPEDPFERAIWQRDQEGVVDLKRQMQPQMLGGQANADPSQQALLLELKEQTRLLNAILQKLGPARFS